MSLLESVKLAGAVLAAACCSGCFTLDVGRLDSTGDENLLVTNYGWYLFNWIPLASGNASKRHWTPWVLFRDDVTMDKVQRRFIDYARDHGKAPTEMTYHNYESILFEVPGSNFKIPIPYLFTYREIQLSGVLK